MATMVELTAKTISSANSLQVQWLLKGFCHSEVAMAPYAKASDCQGNKPYSWRPGGASVGREFGVCCHEQEGGGVSSWPPVWLQVSLPHANKIKRVGIISSNTIIIAKFTNSTGQHSLIANTYPPPFSLHDQSLTTTRCWPFPRV